MACISCNTEKPSDEFPPYNASANCEHPCLICFRCLIGKVEEAGKCAYPGCKVEISKSCDEISLFKAMVSDMFTEYDCQYSQPVTTGDGSCVNVTDLTGSSIRVPFTPMMTVLDLKRTIQTKLKTEVSKQKLLYKDTEMMTSKEDRTLHTLLDYGVESNATINLVVCLYAITSNLKHAVFDLFWGFPAAGPDFLDASCLIFNGLSLINIVDFTQRPDPAVKHSGDIMDEVSRKGHHTIEVFLDKIPDNVTHMFFTLSAWNAPNISKYPNPSLRFFDASEPTKDLCSTTFTHASHSQAVVMCSMSKSRGYWEIFDSGKLSAGNARHYRHIVNTISQLISSGY